MDENTSQASAGTTETPAGSTPQTTETQTTTTTTATEPTPAEVLQGENIDQIKALLRSNNDGLLRSKEDRWTGFGEEEEPGEPAAKPVEETSTAEAKPGKDGKNTETAEPTAEEKAAAEAAAKTETTKPDAKNLRLRTDRFSGDSKLIIDLMAEDRALTFDEARAQLAAAGKLSTTATAPAATARTAPETPQSTGPDPIATKDAEIADLEKQIEEAGETFDTKKLAKLNIAHNKALAERTSLQLKAEQAQAAAQTQGAAQLESAISESESAAIALFPDAGVPGSELYQEIENLLAEASPETLRDPNHPVTLAAMAARNIGYKPTAAPPPAKVVAKSTARAPIAPESGNTPGATQSRTPSLEERAKAAGDDVGELQKLLREAGRREMPEF